MKAAFIQNHSVYQTSQKLSNGGSHEVGKAAGSALGSAKAATIMAVRATKI